jgi:antitoxin (DNA-binding transcriptional repressor) of toxin-antitoxin stability system
MTIDSVYPWGVPIVNMHEAKTHLSRLVAAGEFVIARDGRPVARVTPIVEKPDLPRVGFMPGLAVPDDFDEFGADEIAGLFGTAER